ncbi:MAG: hypothetical protein BM485_15260 [Desulfobulbaceae bacterium DB1]|nr:MAG: hypothetical protein BM485_15260 [Desulfobulbaceae bacterium DB1]
MIPHQSPIQEKEYQPELLRAIASLAARYQVELYVVGGTVRDRLTGVAARDLDLAVSGRALEFARQLAGETGGTFVLLDAKEETARVVLHGFVVDIAGFRQGAVDIRHDLVKRDFTINSLAVPFGVDLPVVLPSSTVIDPTGGLDDIRKKTIRALSSEAFIDDPLRLLRAFRFFAETGFRIEEQTLRWIEKYRDLLAGVAPERIACELDCLMASGRSFAAVGLLKETGLLGVILPELLQGEGVDQPSSHHLDVFAHNLEALKWMEKIVEQPGAFYPSHATELETYLAIDGKKTRLQWAALFHDLGKPAAVRVVDDRITFYNHDRLGADLFLSVAARLRWSRQKRDDVARLISLHMWPFHLCNVRRKNDVTPRSCLKLYKAAGQDLPGLFLLAMADSLAGQGPGKPPGMEKELAGLFDRVHDVCRKQVEPVLAGPPLLTGSDLIAVGLVPGPFFKDILGEAEKAQVEGTIRDRSQALAWLRDILSSR